jgi:DNA helicase-2/ATP-dependent DNA helicase PcrA
MAVEDLFEAERKAIINHHRGPAIVVAGPGTGKTTILAERIVNLCRQDGCDPTGIVAVTFTNHAANQMKEKVAERFGEREPPAVHIATLHAFAKRILHRYSDKLELPSYFRVVGGFQEDILIADARFELKNQGLNLGRYQNKYLSRFKASRALVPDLDTVNQIPGKKGLATQQQFDQCYQSLLSYYHSVDWYDVVALAVKVLQNHANDVLQEVADEIDHLLVDEYQDLNRADHELIRLIATKAKSLMVLGDDDQSIYQTGRFANPGGIKRFTDIYPGAKVYPLSVCWRCGSSILESAWKLIDQGERKMPERMPKRKPIPNPQRGVGTFEVKSLKSEKAEIETVLSELRKELKGTDPPTDILILFHSKEIGFKYVDAMKSADLEFQNLLGQSEARSKSLTLLYEMLRLFDDETDNLSARYLLEKFFIMDSHWITQVRQASRRSNEPLWRRAVWSEGATEKVKAWEQKLQRWRQADDVSKVLSEIIQYMGIKEEPGIEKIQEWCKSREKPNIKSVIERLERGFDFEEPPQEESTGRSVIKVMTMHGAKGVDADVAFVPALEDELIPNEWYEPEQRRLLYVSMTRAKRRLLLSWAWSRVGKAIYRNPRRAATNRRRSRFLAEIE